MPATTSKGFRYPTAGDNPAVHTDIQNLATDIDTALDTYLSTTGITSIVFEGTTADSAELTLTTVDPSTDRTITLPDLTGTVMLRDASETMSNKTLGSNLAAGNFRITGLGTPTSDTDAATRKSAYDNSRVIGMLLGGM